MNHLDGDLVKVALAFYEHLATPRAITCYMMVKSGMWDSIASLRCDPAHYLDAVSSASKFARDYQATEFLRKCPRLPTTGGPKRRREEAVRLFHASEEQCLGTNLDFDLRELRRGTTEWSPYDARLDSILDRARKILSDMLGNIPADLGLRFGPGTSYELKGSPYTTVMDKLTTTPQSTSDCHDIFMWLYNRSSWGVRRYDAGLPSPTVTRGNRFSTVKKDATKDRGMCIEPLGNLGVQLAVGDVLKAKLAATGLHVGRAPFRGLLDWKPAPYEGQTAHRSMARAGSQSADSWATIDLSNASDTMALRLVRRVLRADWYRLLCAARSPYTLLSGQWHRLEKFSSMGNGFTFELMTSVLTSIIAACCDLKPGHDLFVYGDDIIVPARVARDAMAVIRAVGFTPNDRKSYITGPFRESCGGDYFCGFDVRPIYADAEYTEPTHWIVLHNQLRWRWGSGPHLHRCIQPIPLRLRFTIPPRLGDRGLHGPVTEIYRRNHPHTTWCRVVVPTTPRLPLDRWGAAMHLTAVVYGAVTPVKGLRERGQFVSIRGEPTGYRVRLASIS